ncbi:bifunctional adenosylcobinamide kinase/adenosylcobinamide-phosphate guanylyltransferase [Ralstonia pseudosolanacearum]
MSRRLTLVLGGARSGKSHHAEQLALQCAGPVTYIATARESDEEMQLRIALHRARRPDQWTIVEEPVRLAETLYTHARHGGCVLVDCLTLWLNNLLFAGGHDYPETGPITPPAAWSAEIEALLTALPLLPGEVILVSNEIGLGVVPMGAVTRFYVDELGRLNQRLAAQADRVHLLVAGIPMPVKGPAISPAELP